jgi:ParB family chromosome partitioning protein
MNRTRLLIKDIKVIDRQRLDLGDIQELAQSISRFGLIQPIVVNQENRLIAGGRRLAAHEYLNKLEIDVVYKETLTDGELHEMELEENVRRREMSWQERSLNILKIHELKCKRSAIEGAKWGQQETAEMLGLASKASVSYNNEIALRLRQELLLDANKPRRYWACDSITSAWKLRLRDEADMLNASLAQKTAESFNTTTDNLASLDDLIPATVPATQSFSSSSVADVSHAITDADILLRQQRNSEDLTRLTTIIRTKGFAALDSLEAEDLYRLTEHDENETFQSWYDTRKAKIEPWLTIPLSTLLHHGSCIDFMLTHPESVDHIITDPPYGIDMDMLAQQNTGMSDIDTVEAEHVVGENVDLFAQVFPAAFNALKPNGYFILWCDIMQWNTLYAIAINTGFKAQRWPITWVKTHRCMNQSAAQNFTKTTEIAMVCRKGTATLSTMAGECHILAPHDEYKTTLGHPFVKPFDVWKYLIEHVSYEGQTILEPFAGRGSGVISLARMKRKFLACELNDAHYNALVENVKQHYLAINPNYQFK